MIERRVIERRLVERRQEKRPRSTNPEVQASMDERDERLAEVSDAVARVDRLQGELLKQYELMEDD